MSFTVKKDGQDIELDFVDPKAEVLMEATVVYNKTFAKLLDGGGLLRKKLATKLKEQGMWDDDRQKELDEIQKRIVQKEHTLHKGGIKLSEAKELALSIRDDRNKQAALLSSYNEYDNMTIEGQSDNARFNFLVYASTVYKDTEKRYFASYEDFATYSDPVAFIAANKYATEYYNLDEDFESNLPENKFLKEQGFVNNDLRFVDKNGNFVDNEGNRVDEFGNRVDEDGDRVDAFGFKRTEDGKFADEPSPFLDDSGKPIKVDSEVKATRKNKVAVTEDSA
jgi:hypothetical protein